jgi:hypothetical protein
MGNAFSGGQGGTGIAGIPCGGGGTRFGGAPFNDGCAMTITNSMLAGNAALCGRW